MSPNYTGTISFAKQEALARVLAVGHFTAQQSATAADTLIAAAAEVGLDAEEAQKVRFVR